MNLEQEYNRWLSHVQKDAVLRLELESMRGKEAQLKDRFNRSLEFGTGGLRGVMGAGTNRMNLFVISKATRGLAHYLQNKYEHPSVCIAYDTRNMSREFARQAAQVLCANGITVFFFDTVHPTPMLSFAVRHKKASAGIVITASHNPKEYNGYKVYGADGGQITDQAAAEISTLINACDVFDGIPPLSFTEALDTGLIVIMEDDVDQAYYSRVKSLVIRKDLVENHADNLKIVYSPLHGTGNIPVRRTLAELGFHQVRVVKEQELPDGNFSTTPFPNPEEPSVFRLAVEKAEFENPDLILATDPDCDRIGVMIKNDAGEFVTLTGNQIGALLCEYIIRSKKELGSMPPNPAIIKTIVTSDIGKRICVEANVAVFEVLTGFKYIGELAEQWDRNRANSFLFGFEESYGYLAGSFVRDKDGIIAAVLIAEMALYYKNNGTNLYQALQKLYQKYGYFAEKLISVSMAGEEGPERIDRIITGLRMHHRQELRGEDLFAFEDYMQSVRIFCIDGKQEQLNLPKSNVLKFIFTDDSWFALRASGTEPKIKMYLSAAGSSSQTAHARLAQLEAISRRILKAP
ncbi:MAG: phospho-sugar mutase [Clostridia bacterium]|nr:phospho-sugar mutase [Clostridia bacterium]